MSRVSPKIASKAGFPWMARTRLSRDARVGNVESNVDMVAAAVAPNTKPHSTAGRVTVRAVMRATAVDVARSSPVSLRAMRIPGRPCRPVVGEEQLLERRLPAEQPAHPRRGQRLEDRLHRARDLAS